jgi:Domain of unknown function (DUF4218)
VVDFAKIGKERGPKILDLSALSEIRDDMAKTTTPTWMVRGPSNIGNAGHGKLKADQWRTVCTVNFVITLIRIWGQVGSTPTQEEILRNFLALVTAVRWATMRSTSEERIAIVEEQLQIYLTTLVKIYSTKVLKPKFHLALHLPELLRAFGPVHGWWCFPFERYNGILQRKNKNNKRGGSSNVDTTQFLANFGESLGQLELTFLRSFCRGGNLKVLLSRDDLPDTLKEIKIELDKHFNGHEFRGTLSNDLSAIAAKFAMPTTWNEGAVEEALPDDIYDHLLERINLDSGTMRFYSHKQVSTTGYALAPLVQYSDEIEAGGVQFSTARHFTRNSLILYRRPGELEHDLHPGQIQEIFRHCRRGITNDPLIESFLVIRPFEELTEDEANFDPYRRFPLLGVSLYHDKMQPAIVIKSTDIVSHFASCPFENDIIKGALVVLSLERVRPNDRHLLWTQTIFAGLNCQDVTGKQCR